MPCAAPLLLPNHEKLPGKAGTKAGTGEETAEKVFYNFHFSDIISFMNQKSMLILLILAVLAAACNLPSRTNQAATPTEPPLSMEDMVLTAQAGMYSVQEPTAAPETDDDDSGLVIRRYGWIKILSLCWM